jgi:ABC-type amino acid transport substrate-binding protein/mono/diheme cytochrome c family protein
MFKLGFNSTRGFLSSAALVLAASTASLATAAEPLRVCSDPDNLPFSKSEGADRGLYIELAEMVGKRLGTTVEYVWWLSFNQRRALRNTMDGCDAYFALPADAQYRVKGIEKSNAFLNLSYAIVAPAGQTFKGLADLKGKRVGVIFGSPPQIMLATREGYTWNTFRTHEQLFEALTNGEVDLALMWGPIAGFDNLNQFNSRWQVLPVSGESLSGQVAVAVSKSKPGLKEQINQALEDLKPEIAKLTVKYGFPTQTPIDLASSTKSWKAPAVTLTAQHKATPVNSGFIRVGMKEAQKPEWLVANASLSTDEAKSVFNNKCSHCHGANGASPVQERDLRKLSMRYKENWKDVAFTTISKGRPDYGMPTWSGIIPDEEIKSIIEFLVTVQRN